MKSLVKVSLLAALGVLGFNGAIAEAAKSVNASKFFPYYDKFLSLPPSSRDGIIVNYYAKSDGKPPENVYIVHKGVRTKLNFASDGKVLNLPNLEMVKYGQIEMVGAVGKKNSIGFSGDPNIPLSNKIEVKHIRNSVDDLRTCMKIVGPLAMVIPKVDSVAFKGANSAKAILPDGTQIALPMNKDGLLFDLKNKKLSNAVFIEFSTRPTSVVYSK